MELTRHQKVTYGIAGVLGIVLFGILMYMQVLRFGKSDNVGAVPQPSVGGLRASEAAERFDTDVLRDPRFQELDRTLLDAGRLPVPAPAVRGRPNLF